VNAVEIPETTEEVKPPASIISNDTKEKSESTDAAEPALYPFPSVVTPFPIDFALPRSLPEPLVCQSSGIGNFLRDAGSISSDEESFDSGYKTLSETDRMRRVSQSSYGSGPRQNQKRGSHSRISSTSSSASRSTLNSIGASNSSAKPAPPFPCPLALYGCSSSFMSKNEWKRHVSTQHIKPGFWRCDLCPATTNPHNPSIIYHNDFNRKDLFTQHLRRFHTAPPFQTTTSSNHKEYPVNEDNLTQHQKRCYQQLRLPPPASACLFCDRTFAGPGSWDERMEHVGRHLEKDRKTGGALIDIKDWQEDEIFREWLIEEGLVVKDPNGDLRLGDGKPRGNSAHNEGGSNVDDNWIGLSKALELRYG